jgi:hypothetical protein
MNFEDVVFTTNGVIHRGEEILFIAHDDEDNWQFLPALGLPISELAIVTFETLIELDDSLSELPSIPAGKMGKRKAKGNNWEIVSF